MDYINSFNQSNNFEIKKLNDEKLLIKIPLTTGTWNKEYDMNDPISKLVNDLNAEKNLDISEYIFKSLKYKKGSFSLTDKLKILLEEEQLLSNQNLKFIGKPFNNPFEIFVFNKISKILNIQSFQDETIQYYGLNDYGPSSAYCNGNNHLYISGGEKNNNQLIDKLFDINLINNIIEGPFIMSPKKIIV